jgi:ribonuclease BN (tRNA processing enzyme)
MRIREMARRRRHLQSGEAVPASRLPAPRRLPAIVAAILVTAVAARASAQASCSTEPLALQVLGSGGPSAGDTRASTGYLIWRGGRAVVMVDAGGGTFLRFGEAGAKLQDLSLLAVSHLHPDHVSDLPALLWLSELARQQRLKIAGPSGGGAFPSFDAFLERLFDAEAGAFPVLGGTLGQIGQGVPLDVVVVDAADTTARSILSDTGLEVRAVGVPHGNVPSLAYRIDVDGRSIVFGSDQNGSDPGFSTFASGADVLVMHLGLSERAAAPVTHFHAKPATVGQLAQEAGAKRLVLSHLMTAPPTVTTPEWFSLFDLDHTVAEVGTHFSGPIITAADLQCIPIP